ncbi:MAG TPA: ABC transporter substrate-binding protein [Syntrophorhabdaceae bacterium]|jgi:branched-chain amino acid transport system substrate-binding protein
MIRKSFICLALCTLFLCSGVLSVSVTAMGAENTEVLIGGLFSVTGNLKTLGENSKTAMEMAVADANGAAQAAGSPLRFKAAIYDTGLDPTRALDGIKTMAGKGVKFVIGPQSSEELVAVKSFADSSGIFVISQSSTAGSLAIQKDNIFRFCPTDEVEGAAIATFMRRDRVKVVIPAWRDDPGNDGLQKAVRKAVVSIGGKVTEGIKYSASTQDYAPIVNGLAAQVDSATKQTGSASVAVYLAGFDEVAAILALASDNPVLRTVKWYGNDGAALSKKILDNPKAAAFAEKTNFLCLIFGIEENSKIKWSSVISRIEEKAGRLTDAYALAAYDAVRVVAATYVKMGGKVDSTEELRKTFVSTANGYRGTTGRTTLNGAGDRKYGNYDFWAVRKMGDGYQWKLTGSYEAE